MLGQYDLGLRNIKLASRIGYNDTGIHSDSAVFLTDHGFFKDARDELEKATLHYVNLSGVYNNWGYYYHKLGKYHDAILSFRKAIALKSGDSGYYNNLALSLYQAGEKEEAYRALKKSLEINDAQPRIHKFKREKF
jgi:Flp pilus assembly protein TadD